VCSKRLKSLARLIGLDLLNQPEFKRNSSGIQANSSPISVEPQIIALSWQILSCSNK
jgi:hypothetical protein